MKIEKDVFNSGIFGINMGNIIEYSPEDSNKEISETIQKSCVEGYDHLAVKIAADNNRLVNCFLGEGFYIVDSQVTFVIDVHLMGAELQKHNKNTTVSFHEIANEREKNFITTISKKAFTNDRFHSDFFLPKERANQYYMKWSNNCCEGLSDKVYVLTMNDKLIGYITLSFEEKNAIVGLAAITPEFRGKGMFSELIKHTIGELFDSGKERLFYGTQLSNSPVLSTMRGVDGRVFRCNHVLHYIKRNLHSSNHSVYKRVDNVEVTSDEKNNLYELTKEGFHLEETGIKFSTGKRQILSDGMDCVKSMPNDGKVMGGYYLLI